MTAAVESQKKQKQELILVTLDFIVHSLRKTIGKKSGSALLRRWSWTVKKIHAETGMNFFTLQLENYNIYLVPD
jgi:hypothetical protein